MHRSSLLKDLLLETKDGDWGRDSPADGCVRYGVIRATDFAKASIGDASGVPVRYIPERTAARRTLRPGDILIETAGGTATRPTGRTMYVSQSVLDAFDSPVTCASFARFMRPDPMQLDSRFLYWHLQDLYQRGHIDQYQVQHTGVARFQFTNFAANHRVPLPPLRVQRAIAEVLSALDDKIAANTKFATAADDYLSVLFEGALRNGGGEASLRDIAEVNPEKRSPSDGTLRYIDIASVGVGFFEFPKDTSWADAPGRARRGVRSGDIVWSTVRPNRRSHALILDEDPSLVASTGLAVIRSAEWPWVYEAMRRPEFTAYLESVAEGSAYPAVRADRFLNAKLPVVDSAAREIFNERAAAVRSAVALKSVENRRLAATRDVFLPALMSGRLAVRDAEPAVESAVDSGAVESPALASGTLW